MVHRPYYYTPPCRADNKATKIDFIFPHSVLQSLTSPHITHISFYTNLYASKRKKKPSPLPPSKFPPRIFEGHKALFEGKWELQSKYVYFRKCRPNLGHTQSTVQCVSGAFTLGVKCPVREAHHLPQSNAEIKHKHCYSSTLQMPLGNMRISSPASSVSAKHSVSKFPYVTSRTRRNNFPF
jgi:hypothetical protein